MQSYSNPSSIDGAESTRLDSYWLQQKLFNGGLVIRAGQIAQQDDYGVQEYGASYLLEPLGYAFGNLFGNVTATFDPASKPGVEVRVYPGDGFYGKAMFQGGETNPYGDDKHVFDFDTDGPRVLAMEIGYRHDDVKVAPEMAAGVSGNSKDGKQTVAPAPTIDGPKTLFESGLAAVYKLGARGNSIRSSGCAGFASPCGTAKFFSPSSAPFCAPVTAGAFALCSRWSRSSPSCSRPARSSPKCTPISTAPGFRTPGRSRPE